MGQVLAEIDQALAEWLAGQHVFFVATAPRADSGHLNCSPKGGDTFRVLGPHEIAYLDLTGSGIESIAHIQENQRIVLMFCAFTGPPKIIRIHGRASVVYPDDPRYQALSSQFVPIPGARLIVHVDVTRVSQSCGFGVLLMDFRSDRDALQKWASQRTSAELIEYRRKKNAASIDGLPGYRG